jgi:hypothetical protein
MLASEFTTYTALLDYIFQKCPMRMATVSRLCHKRHDGMLGSSTQCVLFEFTIRAKDCLRVGCQRLFLLKESHPRFRRMRVRRVYAVAVPHLCAPASAPKQLLSGGRHSTSKLLRYKITRR